MSQTMKSHPFALFLSSLSHPRLEFLRCFLFAFLISWVSRYLWDTATWQTIKSTDYICCSTHRHAIFVKTFSLDAWFFYPSFPIFSFILSLMPTSPTPPLPVPFCWITQRSEGDQHKTDSDRQKHFYQQDPSAWCLPTKMKICSGTNVSNPNMEKCCTFMETNVFDENAQKT